MRTAVDACMVRLAGHASDCMETRMLRIWLVTCACLSLVIAPWAGAGSYDPEADPASDLSSALVTAAKTDRQVLMVAGGAWCSWCVILDRFIARNPDIRAALDSRFVLLHVYAGEDNPNTVFFGGFPPAEGYPHFWVLDSTGRVLQSVNTGPLESSKERGYDKTAFLQFVERAGTAR
jgi:hypothetical protein